MLGGLALNDHVMLTKFIRRLSTMTPTIYQVTREGEKGREKEKIERERDKK
jgi:hypothetical protein